MSQPPGYKEAALYELLDDIPVPKVIAHGETEIGAFSLLEFMRGQRLIDAGVAPGIAHELGRILGRMNGRRFDRVGDLKVVDGKLTSTDWDFGPSTSSGQVGGVDEFHRWVLFESPAGRRLGTDLRDAVWALLQDSAEDNGDDPHLVHADFNPTNIFVNDGRVTAILDWEFAHAGSIYSDLGNLFRRRPELALPPDFAGEVIAGLKEEGVHLPRDWRKRALVTDLSSALEFLSSKQERPQTHARAREQVVETLKLL